MSSFDENIKLVSQYLSQVEGTLILIGVTEDTVLRDYAINVLRERLDSKITLRDFRFDSQHISLLEGAAEIAGSSDGPVAISATGLEALWRDKQSEAIYLLNSQRNRLGQSSLAIILWLNQSLLSEVSTKAADFYSWRSHTFSLEPPQDWNRLESQKRSYLQALLYKNQYVNLQGLAPIRGGQIVQMRMDEIFIPLRAEQEIETVLLPPPPFDDPAYPDFDEEVETSPVKRGRRISYQTRLSREGEWQAVEDYVIPTKREVKSRPVELNELFRERRAIVLGDPGSGKTTLMRYVAYRLAQAQIEGEQSELIKENPQLADRLPVYVRIGLYAQHLQQNPEAKIDEYAPLSSQALQIPLPDELLKSEMAAGRVFFLLDGLDEIINTAQRRDVARRVEEFARNCHECPVLVTSRIVGYREARLSDQFSQFTIRRFEEPEIRSFVEKWYSALGEPHRAESLTKAIIDSDSIRNLASNPLLLTVIALIHRRKAKLPQRRVSLYKDAAETLVDEWMSERRVIPEGWDAQETIDILLPAIGWHLHRTSSSGLIGEQELHELLVNTMKHHEPRLSESEAQSRAALFRRNVNEFSGISLERGLDKDGRGLYGFLHLTFEEYFAAVRLCEVWDREGNEALKPLLHNPRWTEIVLLAAGRFGEFSQYQATRFVRSILEAGSEYEDILHRDLLLAARCLGDDIRVDPDLRRKIVASLIKLYFDQNSPDGLKEDVLKMFGRLGGTAAEPDLLDGLTRRLSNSSSDVRSAAARALGQIGEAAASEQVISVLIPLLSDSELYVRSAAATALGQLSAFVRAENRPQAIKQYLSLARSKRNKEKRNAGYIGLRNALAAQAE